MKDKLAIIVPYRDREEHLNVFVPHIHEFLKDKGIRYSIFIIEQSDDRPFNYGKLCNAAVKEIPEEYTYFAFHDIDMLPMNDECDYAYPESPTHLATNVEVHNNELPYPQYFGGVIVISREDFENANGYSNEYWGYGFQDLDLLKRLERSGAYLEKFYDLNNVYSTYDELDILPYRIENVKITSDKKGQTIHYNKFSETNYIYGPINPILESILENSFSVSFWFNDSTKRKNKKNLVTFEGCDTGVFLSKGNELIFQIWDNLENYTEILLSYARNRWNHCTFSYDSENKKIRLTINDKSEEIQLNDDFELYDYKKHCIKISDKESQIDISNVLLYDTYFDSPSIQILYDEGNFALDALEANLGIAPSLNLRYDSLYKNNILLDFGKSKNHIKVYDSLDVNNMSIIPNELYLPIRTDGVYKSLQHKGDKKIIEKYYKYNPDIEENADIFFEDVLKNNLDYKSIGLNTLNYKVLNIENKKTYELIRIVT